MHLADAVRGNQPRFE